MAGVADCLVEAPKPLVGVPDCPVGIGPHRSQILFDVDRRPMEVIDEDFIRRWILVGY